MDKKPLGRIATMRISIGVVCTITIIAASSALAAAPLECKVKGAYKAELAGTGNNRTVMVTFNKKPSSALASKIVRDCMEVAIAQDPKHELLGSAWVGESQFKLAPGKEYLAYKPSEKEIHPFGLGDAVLKRK